MDHPEQAVIVDGIWPDTETYVDIPIPQEWLNEFALEHLADSLYTISIPLAQLIQERLSTGPCPLSLPSRQQAEKTISALRRYADELENLFVSGPDAYDQNEASKDLAAYVEQQIIY